MNITPASDVLILTEIQASNRTPAGLIIPDTNEKDSVSKGEVIAAGEGELNKAGTLLPNPYKVGDIVVFEKRRALPVTYEGGRYLFINAKEIFGTVKSDDTKEEVH